VTEVGPVREHYASEDITTRVLTALRAVNGPDVGEGAKEWRINAMRSLRDRRTSMIEALARKPA
jgi:hypothetical protein